MSDLVDSFRASALGDGRVRLVMVTEKGMIEYSIYPGDATGLAEVLTKAVADGKRARMSNITQNDIQAISKAIAETRMSQEERKKLVAKLCVHLTTRNPALDADKFREDCAGIIANDQSL